jgi:hypothetical protein
VETQEPDRIIDSLKYLLIPCAKCEVGKTTLIAFNPVDEFVNFGETHIKISKPTSGKVEALGGGDGRAERLQSVQAQRWRDFLTASLTQQDQIRFAMANHLARIVYRKLRCRQSYIKKAVHEI